MDQYEFVEACLIKYKTEPLPEGQWWEDAHFPVPRCKGGTETVRLWRSDHAIQGLLQSEEFDHPCIWGDEKGWIPEEYSELYEKWFRRSRQNAQSGLPKHILRQGCLNMRAGLTEAQRAENRNKAKESILARNPNHYTEMGKKARSLESPQTKADRARNIPLEARHRALKKVNARRYRCQETGYISTAGPLSRYQQARGIDTSRRELITDS